MKKNVLLWLALIAVLLVAIFDIWALSRHGTMGMLRMNLELRLVFMAIGLIALAAALAGVLGVWYKSRGQMRLGRLITIASLVLALPCLLGIPSAYAVLSGLAQPSIGDTPPQLFITTGTGAYGLPDLAVTFNTAQAIKNSLTWGKMPFENGDEIITESKATRSHAFLLTNLEPNTAYYYRLGNDAPYVFHTASINGTLHFAVGSDAHYGLAAQPTAICAEMLRDIADPQNAFDYLFLLGDTTHLGFFSSHWHKAFNELSQATAVIPVRLAPGNHDTMFSGLDNYLRYAYPDDLPLGSGSKLWTRLDVGRIHFFIIDLEWSAEAFTAEQAVWLENELKNTPADDWKIVLGHGFTYASGLIDGDWRRHDNPETVPLLTPLFEKYGVDLVFSGHNHQMEILAKSGVTYVLSAPFGGALSNPRTYESPYSLWYESGQYGFADVTVSGNEAEIIFRASDGHEIYRHSLVKGLE